MSLFWIKEDTTVGELKNFLAKIPDESKIYTQELHGAKINLRLDDYPKSESEHELYIEEL